jgi:hypothetical protein
MTSCEPSGEYSRPKVPKVVVFSTVENHSSRINAIICWPTQSDVLGGFSWLQRAANQDYPPAVYALGARLKHGIHVPRPTYWHGPAGNVFRQPDHGHNIIDKAISRGYKPSVDESMYYWHVYRKAGT